MDFSVYEKRQLAVLERQLSDDRRLVRMLAVFDTGKSRLRRRLQCALIRLRHRRPVSGSRAARIAVIVAACLTVAGPVTLIVALTTHLQVLSIAAVTLLPLAPIMLVITQQWARRPVGPEAARRSKRPPDPRRYH